MSIEEIKARHEKDVKFGNWLSSDHLIKDRGELLQRIAELESQLADRFKTFEEWKASIDDINELAESVVVCELDRRIAELEFALKKYGWHGGGCPSFDASVCENCTCGFDTLMDKNEDVMK